MVADAVKYESLSCLKMLLRFEIDQYIYIYLYIYIYKLFKYTVNRQTKKLIATKIETTKTNLKTRQLKLIKTKIEHMTTN